MADIADIDVVRAAALLIRQHGDEATARATERARALAAEGDQLGAALWMRIVKAITDQQRGPAPGEPVH